MPADFKRVNQAARDLLAKCKMTVPPFDPEAIAEAEGIDVVYRDFDPEISAHISGYSDANTDSIYINKAIPARRKIFTIAHELAHLLLHRAYVTDEGRYAVMPRRNFYGSGKPVEEQEADAFAAELLVPLDVLRRYKPLASDDELARLFAVSPEVITHRSKRL